MKQIPDISIIVPVYNAEKYLPVCLDSLIGQTMHNIEIICVNNKSSDDSAGVLQAYANKDSRIKVFNRNGNSVSDARNFGIDIARGEYILFVDSDDWLDINTCAACYRQAKTDNSELVNFNAFGVKGKKRTEIIYFGCKRAKVCSWLDFREHIFVSFFHSWHFLYKASLLKSNAVKYPDCRICEDVPFVLQTILAAKSISFLPECFYYYVYRKDSAVNNEQENPANMNFFNITEEISNILREYKVYDKFKEQADVWKYKHFLWIYKRIPCALHQKYIKMACSELSLKRQKKFVFEIKSKEFRLCRWLSFKIYTAKDYVQVYLWGFLPVYKIKVKTHQKKHLLFNFIPYLVFRNNYGDYQRGQKDETFL